MKLNLAALAVPVVPVVDSREREPPGEAGSFAATGLAGLVPAFPVVLAANCNVYGESDAVRAALPFRLRDGGDAGGVIIGPDGLASAVRDLVERYGARLDVADLLERVEERAAVMEFDGGVGAGGGGAGGDSSAVHPTVTA